MQIDKLNTTSFGLAKTKEYRDYEKSLIKQAQVLGKENDARLLADKIGRKVPNGLLDVDNYEDVFVLTETSDGKTSSHLIPKSDKNNPVRILFDLNRALGQYQRSSKSIKAQVDEYKVMAKVISDFNTKEKNIGRQNIYIENSILPNYKVCEDKSKFQLNKEFKRNGEENNQMKKTDSSILKNCKNIQLKKPNNYKKPNNGDIN